MPCIIFIFCFFLPVPAVAAGVSVLVVEVGLKDGSPVRNGEMTEVWESGVMDVLFDEGHIVTNAQAFALERRPAEYVYGLETKSEIQTYIEEAGSSGLDYFVLVFLCYEKEKVRADAPKPSGAELNLYSIKRGKRLWFENIDLSNASNKEERLRVKRYAHSLAAFLGESL